MLNGTVKWFNNSKGYGFIESDSKDYFVHYKSIDVDGFKSLEAGQSVTFESETGPKGLIATKVVPN